ncbi:S41 family peptidase [Flagellimonas nanhaiensis]|uniref:Carboxyl-terminal protease n=1 Tax=Flagellimonas nanhaiensis TaxID=2292706 RepID=A0A371JTY2_9FLAO|nr:S41 family peptidase [Allomuricauda nanhaiensis]RDY61254.1 carboxyl-terminal protease [Allomuricauda nanhaiensis]
MKKYIFLLLGLSLFVFACSNDDGISNGDTPDPTPGANVTVQNFMWQAMNLWYFWQEDVDVLSDTNFSSNEDYTNFLQATPNPEDFYFDVLLFGDDRFSFLNDDYSELVNNLSGVSRSNGLEFDLNLFDDEFNVFGFVLYILPNSDASTKTIKRGDIFTRVDGQQLTVNNYRDLLFGENSTYTLGLADIVGTQIVDNDTEVTLTKIENQVEDPILVAETLDVNGTKIAYLMYNRFLSSFNVELNDAFGKFVEDGATELVLDMRYNPGGSVNTSRLLASMIYGTNTSDLYIRQRWNSKIQAQLSSGNLEDYFASSFKINPDDEESIPVNTLNLQKIYVLATGSSASASELVMNGLAPYVDIVHIGSTTRGKNEFSITLVDDPENNFPFLYSSTREASINPDNSWGLQPLVGRNENANGFYDYTNGLAPNIILEEDLANMGVLGDPNEPLLAKAIQEITGASSKKGFSVQMPAKSFISSRLQTPLRDNMYLDKPLHIEIE